MRTGRFRTQDRGSSPEGEQVKTHSGTACAVLLASLAAHAAVTVTVKADSGRKAISPWIYGRNNSLSDNPSSPVSSAKLALYREAGLRSLRENGGNNSTKYNWRKKLSSHPDWYNNVYAHDWDYSAKILQDSLPGTQGIYAFQLLGYAASSASYNWGDYSFYQTYKFYPSVGLDAAGGGTISSSGVLTTKGTPSKYLQAWPADSTAAILKQWFGTGGIGLDSSRFRYWNMDNEPEVWNGTHNDVDSTTGLLGKVLSPEDYVQRYVKVATAVKAIVPGIKLLGPVAPNEWQWYNWPTGAISYKGATYCWPQYFLKRLGEHKDSTGAKLLDVYDVHFYPGSDISTTAQQLQLHRVYWDTTYAYPNPNGVKAVNGGWDNTIKSEYIFGRLQKWLDTYLGSGNGVTFGMSETGLLKDTSAAAVSVWYASQLGTFADNGMELFTPWDWYSGMWETLHLFSRYGKSTRVKSTSSLDSLVSAYSSVNAAGDSMTVILVNRTQGSTQDVTVNLSGFNATSAAGYQLSGLSGETFVSHTSNALKSVAVTPASGSFTLTLPALSVTAVQLRSNQAPKVSLSLSATKLTQKGSLTAGATATDADGTIASLAIYLDGAVKAAVRTGSISTVLSSLSVGTHAVKARAVDNSGAITYSAASTVTVTWDYALTASSSTTNWSGGLVVGYAIPTTATAAKLEILNSTGTVLKSSAVATTSTGTTLSSVSGYAAGVYTVRLVVDGVTVASKAVTKI